MSDTGVTDFTKTAFSGTMFTVENSSWHALATPKPPQITFFGDRKEGPMVTFHHDGRVIIGEGVQADEVAQKFLDYIVKWWPKTIKARLDEA